MRSALNECQLVGYCYICQGDQSHELVDKYRLVIGSLAFLASAAGRCWSTDWYSYSVRVLLADPSCCG